MSYRFPQNGKSTLVLAPMEGVTDSPMRALMSEIGSFSYFVTEFVRVSGEVLPPKVFRKSIPELSAHGRTHVGAAVQVQLLGGNPERLAQSALHAVQVGAIGIDLNFGCPAPTVNKHDGGATLLLYPTRLRDIVSAVRDAVPKEIPVSAKLRLGWDNIDAIHENAAMAEEGGASWITIHGRTKVQGYVPPAFWEPIGQVRARAKIPVIANGEIWTREDFLRCRDITECEHYMIGRGALANPRLSAILAQELGLAVNTKCLWLSEKIQWLPLLDRFIEICHTASDQDTYPLVRIKQWLRYASKRGEIDFFDSIKLAKSTAELREILATILK
jgi:tRNA-dihydrouridine synthase C